MSGAAENHQGTVVRNLRADDLAHAQVRALLDALAHTDQNRTRPHQTAGTLSGLPHGEGGGGKDHHVAVADAGQVAAQVQLLGEGDAFQLGVHPQLLHLCHGFLTMRPHGDVISVFNQHDGQGGAPSTAA